MAIQYDQVSGLITIHTKHTTYQMLADAHRYLLHLYYGAHIEGSAAQLLPFADRGFSSNPQELGDDRTYSLEQLPQEFPFRGSADFRTSAFRMRNADGSYGCDLRFVSLSASEGKYVLPHLPASYDAAPAGKAGKGGVQTLEITLADSFSGIEVHLLYGVFEDEDIITRAVRVDNHGAQAVTIEKAASCTLDFPYGDFETMTFYGRHAHERNVQRTPIGHGRYAVASLRGASSHFFNPFVIVLESGTNEDAGNAYGIHLVYSGNFLAEAEKSGYDATRFVMGLNDEEFGWVLEPGESFAAPECIMAFSGQGLALLSNRLHRFIRDHVVRGEWQHAPRPVLINNWEATYFHFDGEKILDIARKAAELGIEMMVLDDGWFGKRESDTSGLGDWKVNTRKLGGTLGELSEKIHALKVRPVRDEAAGPGISKAGGGPALCPEMVEAAGYAGTCSGMAETADGGGAHSGMKFGLWIEPEMISEDSDLYRAHPDWAMRVPGRTFSRGRDQLVLDFSRREIVDAIYEQLTAVLDNAEIDYIKWDLNRNITDVYSAALPAARQGEVLHRYVLGVYDLLERLTRRYPRMLIEGCAGGGGRFDCGMLYYTPQIWCSDNTDAIDRCLIQYGTSFGYPPITMGAHVSAVPNEQTGRTTPFDTRAAVAMAGSFGYELDLTKLSAEDAAKVPEQIRQFKDEYEVTHYGDYYRLTDPVGASGPAGAGRGISYAGAGFGGGYGFGGNGAGEIAAWMCVLPEGGDCDPDATPDAVSHVAPDAVSHVVPDVAPDMVSDAGREMPEASERALVTAVFLGAHGNPLPHYLRLKGLSESAVYLVEETGQEFTGSVLMHAGIQIPPGGQYESVRLHLRRR